LVVREEASVLQSIQSLQAAADLYPRAAREDIRFHQEEARKAVLPTRQDHLRLLTAAGVLPGVPTHQALHQDIAEDRQAVPQVGHQAVRQAVHQAVHLVLPQEEDRIKDKISFKRFILK